MRHALVQPVDAAGDRIVDQEKDDHRGGEDDRPAIGLAGHDLRLAHQLGHGDGRGDGAVLDGEDQQRAERRQHADQRLRQDDGPHRGKRGHAKRQGGAHLARPHRRQTGADGLRHVGAEMDAERQNAGGDRAQMIADQER